MGGVARITVASSTRESIWVALVGVAASSLCFALYMRGLDGLHIPLAYRGDALAYLNQIDNMIPRGWYWRSHEMAHPFGQDQSPIAQADLLPYSILWLLARILVEEGRTFNAFILLSCGANASGAFWAARRLAHARAAALLVGFGFAFSYYHWYHLGAHLALGWSFLVPVWMALVLAWAIGEMMPSAGPSTERRSSARGIVGVALLQSLSGVYYSAFLLVTIVTLAGVVAVATRRTRPLLVALRAALVVAVGFVLQAAIQAMARGDFVLPRSVVPRSLGDLEYYSLQPVHLLLPADGYPIARIAVAAARRVPESLRGEGGKYLGFLAIAGLVGLVVLAISRPVSAVASVGRLSARLQMVVAVVLVLVALPGGGGYLLGLAGLRELRVWSRVALPLTLIGLLGLAAMLGIVCAHTSRRTWLGGMAFAAVAVAVWEVSDRPPAAAEAVERWRADAAAVATIRDALPPGAAVLQLPDVPYPEMEPILEFADYEHFRPALHRDEFCWSYGVLRGRTGVGLGLDGLLRDRQFSQRAARAGFDAVWVDLRALTDDQRASLDALMDDGGEWLRPRNDVVVHATERRVGGCHPES